MKKDPMSIDSKSKITWLVKYNFSVNIENETSNWSNEEW